MNPIAVVYWVDKGVEKSKKCFDQASLERITIILRQGNFMSWTCMCSGGGYVPHTKKKKTFNIAL